MHVQHPHPERRRGRDRRRHRVGDVVELQIQENAVATFGQRADDGRPLESEKAAADLETAGYAAEVLGECQRAVAVFDVERD